MWRTILVLSSQGKINAPGKKLEKMVASWASFLKRLSLDGTRAFRTVEIDILGLPRMSSHEGGLATLLRQDGQKTRHEFHRF